MLILAFAALAAVLNAALCAWLGMILFRARGGHETFGIKSKGTWMPVWSLLAALVAIVSGGMLAWFGHLAIGGGVVALGYLLAFAGTSFGHGSMFDQGTKVDGWKDRKEIPVDWIVGQEKEGMTEVQRIARDRAATSWRVFFITVGTGLAVAAGGAAAGLWALLPIGLAYGASGFFAGSVAAKWARKGVDDPAWWWRRVGKIGLKPDSGFNPPGEATEAMVGLLVGAVSGAATVAAGAAMVLAGG